MSYLTDKPVAQGLAADSGLLLWGTMLAIAASVGVFLLVATKPTSTKRKGWLSQRTLTRRVCAAKNLKPKNHKQISC